MTIEHDDPFHDLGYATPEQVEELRHDRLEKAAHNVVHRTTGRSAERSRRTVVATGPQYGEESHVGYPDGRPEDQSFTPLPAEQAARNHRFSQNWRQVADEAIRNGTHAVEND